VGVIVVIGTIIVGILGLGITIFTIWDIVETWKMMKANKEASVLLFLINAPFSIAGLLFGLILLLVFILSLIPD
jgi:ABC-type sulfate transport system permease subunit